MNDSAAPARPASKPTWLPWLLLAGLCGVMFTIRITAPTDLLDLGQQKPAACVLDVVKNGHWLCQTNEAGEVSSKPPLYTWLAALFSLALGRVTMFSLTLPSVLATLGIAWLIFAFGRRQFGFMAGILGALAYLLSPAIFRQVAMARTDAVFSLLVMVGALCALAAWLNQRSWTWFWLVAAAATLTKGPLGVVLAAGGLLAVIWERRGPQPLPLRGSHLAGIVLFLLITVGWFALAYQAVGRALIDKMVGDELVGHALEDGKGRGMAHGFYIPFLYFLSRFAPWSLAACVGFWRVCFRPAAATPARRVERFLFGWFFAGLVIFSIGAHQRADLLFPLMPAAALLAGRELARWLERGNLLRQQCVIVGAIAVGLIAFEIHQQLHNQSAVIQKGQRIENLARMVREQVGDEFPLTHTDDPAALQIFLNTMRRRVSPESAARLLAGDATAFVATASPEKIIGLLHDTHVPVREIASGEHAGKRILTVLGNAPKLTTADQMVFMDGDLVVRMEGLSLVRSGGSRFRFLAKQSAAAVTVTNQGRSACVVRLEILRDDRRQAEERAIDPDHTWRMESSGAVP